MKKFLTRIFMPVMALDRDFVLIEVHQQGKLWPRKTSYAVYTPFESSLDNEIAAKGRA